jgi:hypothetical protein
LHPLRRRQENEEEGGAANAVKLQTTTQAFFRISHLIVTICHSVCETCRKSHAKGQTSSPQVPTTRDLGNETVAAFGLQYVHKLLLAIFSTKITTAPLT